MQHRGLTLGLSLLGVLLGGGLILFGPEGASPGLRLLHVLFLGLGLVGLIGVLLQGRR